MFDEAHVTRLLHEIGDGRRAAVDELLPLVYDDLRAIAGRYFRDEPSDHTLQPTAIVHEAFLDLAAQQRARWRDRAHFQAVAAMVMRRLLVDHARARNALKRGGGHRRVTLAAVDSAGAPSEIDVVTLDDALARLEQLDPRQYRIVEMRFFGGLGEEEIARVLGLSRTTVQADWRMAKAWLSRELRAADER